MKTETLQAGRELDARVAEKRGWRIISRIAWTGAPPDETRPAPERIPAYSRDLMAAWELVRLCNMAVREQSDGSCRVWVTGALVVKAETVCLAICEVFLQIENA